MSACEMCWTEATRKVMLLGGSTADRYRKELQDHSDGHDADTSEESQND